MHAARREVCPSTAFHDGRRAEMWPRSIALHLVLIGGARANDAFEAFCQTTKDLTDIQFDEGISELYDLKNDLSESNNLAEKHPDTVKAMQNRLSAILESMDAKRPRPNPNFSR